jgi:adiponectin receptor
MDTVKAATEKIAEGEKKIEEKLTVLWNDLPSWQQDNHYIHSGYRPASNSYIKSAKSLGYLHNETVNIYTHLIGAILALAAGILMYSELYPRYQTATLEDVFVFCCFFFGAVTCLGMSATYHTISNHSLEVSSFGNKLDYLGIVFLIWGSFIPILYYGFQRHPDLMFRYASMVSRTENLP